MKIGYIQFKPEFGEKEKNLKRILKLLKAGAKLEADLLVLPELSNTGYRFISKSELESLSEKIPDGKTTETLTRAAEEFNMYVVTGVCERSGNNYYNSAILVGPDGYIAKYRKTHLFDEEKIWFTEGDIPYQVHDICKARVGMMICFDWFFPEVVRILALKGAQIICHPSNLILPYCQKAIMGATIQNMVFIITANRVGVERGIRFTGMSQIIDPKMRVLARSDDKSEEVRVVEVDPASADSKKITERNNLWEDRRLDLYKPLLEPTKP